MSRPWRPRSGRSKGRHGDDRSTPSWTSLSRCWSPPRRRGVAYEDTRRFGFRSDDWRMAAAAGAFVDYFRPYNDHLSAVPIAVYRLIYTTFGFDTYIPLRVIGIGSGAGLAVAMYLVYRARIGPSAAFVAGVLLLWYPDLLLAPANFNHYLALIAAIVSAALLMSTRPVSDVALGSADRVQHCVARVSESRAALACAVYAALAARRSVGGSRLSSRPSRGRCGGWSNTTPIVRTTSNSRTLSALSQKRDRRIVRGSCVRQRWARPGARPAAFVLLLGWRLRKGPRQRMRERACVVRHARVLVGRARTFPRQRDVRYVPLQARRLGIRPAGIAPDETGEGTGRRRPRVVLGAALASGRRSCC